MSKVRVIRIPAGKDPDELIRTDPDGWRAAVADAEELLPYFMQRAASEVDLRQPHGRSAYTRRMLDLLRRIPDRVEHDSYVPRLAQLAGIDERILRDELARGPRPMPIRPVDGRRPSRRTAGPRPARARGADAADHQPDARRGAGGGAPAVPRRVGRALAEAWSGHR